ncbi:MAG TPA: Rieske 2Fe-2S domain-containing protein [Acidimicrobiales bacterium]
MTEEQRRQQRAARVISALFLVATACAVGLGVTYWRGGQPQVEGVLLGVAFLSMGTGFALWAKHLLPQGPYVEARPPLATGEAVNAALISDLEREGEIARRPMLVRLVAVAGAALAGAAVFPIRSLGPRPGADSLHTPWRFKPRAVTSDGHPVIASEVPPGGLVTMFPEGDLTGDLGQAVLIRVDEDRLRLPKGREGWAVDGLVAYSKICTHAGCPVGLYQTESHTLLCPCHQSVFDVLRGAEPVTGPASWPLPQLPLHVDADGVVRSAGDFSEPVGPGWWKERGS